MNMPANELASFGHALDLSPRAFGELRRSNDIAHDATQLRARMVEDGYLCQRTRRRALDRPQSNRPRACRQERQGMLNVCHTPTEVSK
jgi:hypothetical protein